MGKIATFDKKTLKMFRADMNKVFAKYEKESGVKVELKNISFSEDSATAKIAMTVKGGVSAADKKLIADFEYLGIFDKLSVKIGDSVRMPNGWEGTVLGANTRAHKYPYLVKRKSDGKTYKIPTDAMERAVKI